MLEQISRPMLALKSTVAEEIVTPLPADVLRAHLPPTAEMKLLDGLGHFLHVEDPDGVAAEVLQFLAGGDSGRG